MRKGTFSPYAFLSVFLLILFTGLQGCYRNIAKERGPLPEIVWPEAPEISRIKFLNSFSVPEHLGITRSAFSRFFSFIGGSEKSQVMVSPSGVAVDGKGRIFVVDTFLGKIHVYDPWKNAYMEIPKGKERLSSPVAIALDEEHTRFFVSDSTKGIVEIYDYTNGKRKGEIKRGGIGRPTGLAINRVTGELLIVDTLNSQIFRVSLDTLGLNGIIGHEGKSEGSFHSPTHIFASGDGKIYVSDSLNFRVQVFSPHGEFLRTFGEAGDTPGTFSRPKGIAVDSEGNVYVVDALFDNVQIFNGEGRLLLAFGGPGHDYGKFWLPSGIFIDGNDRIYVSDTYNKRVQIFQYLKREVPNK